MGGGWDPEGMACLPKAKGSVIGAKGIGGPDIIVLPGFL